MPNLSILTRPDVRAAGTALGAVMAGEASEAEGFPRGFYDIAFAAQRKLAAVPRGGMLIAFSHKELELLWLALGNGAGDDTIMNLGLRADERRILARACNRVAEAGRFGGPRFGED